MADRLRLPCPILSWLLRTTKASRILFVPSLYHEFALQLTLHEGNMRLLPVCPLFYVGQLALCRLFTLKVSIELILMSGHIVT